ncbi:MAG TPA: hypothetical protein ENI31_00660 [Candidatus Omnitrophica bacterium]|nr:MAG: hypothetical protein DRP61_01650 [Candidatus Omnitrophota bacterium]RKY33713.1 MAG: hypothetical protein DRP69_06040 [Candidatus Omnitrophota bacterium]RKY44309.1 MAG: hypothetical protein DRP80_02640 [Candidatus Omnitrophota bacterium]HEC68789.1 hypothetical protein [Candidatus Omnitrophota bacterium]
MRLLFISLLIFSGIANCRASNRIVAVVNKEIITEQELKNYINLLKLRLSLVYKESSPEFSREFKKEKEKALEKLIEDRLIIQEAKRENLAVPDKFIERKLKEFISSFKDEDEFMASLRERGLNLASLKEKIKEQFLIQALLDKEVKDKIEVKPYEVTQYYRAHLEEFNLSPSIEYKALKFSSQLIAFQVFQELKREGVEKILKEYSQNLIEGKLSKKEARAELKELFELKEGEISSPLQIEGEFMIFIINKKNPSQTPSLEEVKEKIWEKLYQEKFQKKLNLWLNSLKEKALIKRY